jgi:UPF0755 protein
VSGELGSNRSQQSIITWRGLEAKILLGVVIFLMICLGFLLLPYGPAHETVVSIDPGMTSKEIAGLLSEADLLQSPILFRIVTKLTRVDNKLKAGTYRLNSRMGTVGIVRALARGDVELVRFTIPEGVSMKDMADLLEAKGLDTSFPPACAISGLPPPPPPVIVAATLTISPARTYLCRKIHRALEPFQ